ncbi:helix-turn-helix domain-containing protein [Pelagibacterium xiamenense]|uniref:helix-turn-helix domain-containing protein n=1 Tax=Pelagibacterium xiamenense TaxID=2901140 RepID=UPI001E3DC150|nr:helix-turn-helix domain-containing protein [Pelagibacterium xiamenense]MCD7060758.1 helix-turn-helix domain-containing protein [Pelagibacterium xiamenense]
MGQILPIQASAPVWGAASVLDMGIRTLRAQDPLIFEGDDADHLYEVVEGVVRVYKVFYDGRRQIISFAFPGDIIGLGQTDTYSFDCDALTFARVRAIPKADLLRTVRERPELGAQMLEMASREITAAQSLSITLCRKSAIERVASFLCGLAERRRHTAAGQTLSVPMTRADIADYLGLTIETVSRNITKLKSLQVISLPEPGAIVIHDMKQLKRIGDCEAGIQ